MDCTDKRAYTIGHTACRRVRKKISHNIVDFRMMLHTTDEVGEEREMPLLVSGLRIRCLGEDLQKGLVDSLKNAWTSFNQQLEFPIGRVQGQ